jgi:MFS-type transporter involved in bile tolerance (Atg22 family)
MFASQRAGISMIIFFFIAGIILLSLVNEKQGKVLLKQDI